MDRVWNERLRAAKDRGIKLWDAESYRIANVDEVEHTGTLVFKLGLVSYRYPATFQELQKIFIENNLKPIYHFSNGAMLRTNDGAYLFGKRSTNGVTDIFGGAVQPGEVAVCSGADIEANILKEVEEEAGLDLHNMDSNYCIGILQSITSNVLTISHMQLNVSVEEVQKIFKNRKDDEMSELIVVPESDIEPFLKALPSYRPYIFDLLKNVEVEA